MVQTGPTNFHGVAGTGVRVSNAKLPNSSNTLIERLAKHNPDTYKSLLDRWQMVIKRDHKNIVNSHLNNFNVKNREDLYDSAAHGVAVDILGQLVNQLSKDNRNKPLDDWIPLLNARFDKFMSFMKSGGGGRQETVLSQNRILRKYGFDSANRNQVDRLYTVHKKRIPREDTATHREIDQAYDFASGRLKSQLWKDRAASAKQALRSAFTSAPPQPSQAVSRRRVRFANGKP